jgi:hypothetical protein
MNLISSKWHRFGTVVRPLRNDYLRTIFDKSGTKVSQMGSLGWQSHPLSAGQSTWVEEALLPGARYRMNTV